MTNDKPKKLLNVYVFYGRNKIGLTPRWCIGFDIQAPNDIINRLNLIRFVNADKNPENWITRDGNTYPVVLLTGIMDLHDFSSTNRGYIVCLNAIKEITQKELKINIEAR